MKLQIALTMVMLSGLLGITAATPLAVAATGNCNTTATWFFRDSIQSGPWVKYCWAVNDSDLESDPGLVMGPLYDNSYRDDWSTSTTASGISQGLFEAPDNTYRLCLYLAKNYQTQIGGIQGRSDGADQIVNFGQFNNNMGSFKVVRANFCG